MAVRKAPPKGLQRHGRRVWRSVTAAYTLTVGELVTLEDVCAMSDRIDQLVEQWTADGCPEVTRGSMGQLVGHPIPAVIERLRMNRNALAARLKLPDLAEDGSEAGEPLWTSTMTRSEHARYAAMSRWGNRGRND